MGSVCRPARPADTNLATNACNAGLLRVYPTSTECSGVGSDGPVAPRDTSRTPTATRSARRRLRSARREMSTVCDGEHLPRESTRNTRAQHHLLCGELTRREARPTTPRPTDNAQPLFQSGGPTGHNARATAPQPEEPTLSIQDNIDPRGHTHKTTTHNTRNINYEYSTVS